MRYRDMHLKASCVAGHIPPGLHFHQHRWHREHQSHTSVHPSVVEQTNLQLINNGLGGGQVGTATSRLAGFTTGSRRLNLLKGN